MRSRGILTFATGKEYARLARGLFLSAKAQGAMVWIVVPEHDTDARDYLQATGTIHGDLKKQPTDNRFWFEQYAYDVTPFDLTLKMDADCFIPKGVDFNQIFDRIEQGGLVNGVPHTLAGTPNRSTAYRGNEVQRGLTSIYSTMFGFAKTTDAHLFFQHIKMFCHWWGAEELPMTKGLDLTTDTVYSMAWAACKSPQSAVQGLPFHHMKPHTLGWGDVNDLWTRDTVFHVDTENRLFINGIRVGLPIHYYDKGFLSEELMNKLEGKDVCSV